MNNTANTPRIFIIDDEQLDNTILKLSVNRVIKDPEVNILTNGEAAIQKLLDLSTNVDTLPNYIFLDINMPVMNGWKFLEKFKELNLDPSHKVQIYIVSSSIYENDVLSSRSNPLVEDFLTKPVNIDRLRTIFAAA
jgi:CheY-like chemotaxis protein